MNHGEIGEEFRDELVRRYGQMDIVSICVGGAIGLVFLYWLRRKTGWNDWGIGLCLGGTLWLVVHIFSIVNPTPGVELPLLANVLLFLLGGGFIGLGIWVIRKWPGKKGS